MTRAIPSGARFFYGLAVAGVVAAIVYGWGSGGGLSGSATFGLLGGVGEQLGVTILLFFAAAAALLGVASTAFRDADPDAVTALAGSERLPEAVPPGTWNVWPAIGAVAAGVMMIGLASSPAMFVLGSIVMGVVVVEWMVAAWADRATGDPEANRQIRNRFMHPVEIPLFAAIGIIVMVLCVSRVLLALPEYGSDAVAIGLAVLILVTATLLALRPTLRRTVVVVIVAIFAVAVIAGGIIGAAHGTRDYEKHSDDTEAPTGESGLGVVQDLS
jgi:hypothetical protein